MVFNAQRILANQIAFEGLYGLLRSLEEAPRSGFSQTGEAFVGKHLDKKVAADGHGSNIRDFHRGLTTSLRAERCCACERQRAQSGEALCELSSIHNSSSPLVRWVSLLKIWQLVVKLARSKTSATLMLGLGVVMVRTNSSGNN